MERLDQDQNGKKDMKEKERESLKVQSCENQEEWKRRLSSNSVY